MGMPGQHTSVTHQTSWGQVAKYVPLRPLSQQLSWLYAAISQKLTAGGKFKLLPEYLTERDV